MRTNHRSMKSSLVPALSLAAFLGAFAPGAAVGADFHLKLSGSQEVPPVQTNGSAQGTISIGDDGSVSGRITVTGFTPTMAHIHEAPSGKNGKVVVPFRMEGDTLVAPAGARLTVDQMKALKAGDLYFNVHSAAHPAGEVRAQIVP